jgi:nitroimidazol reductase NimA-like FMN-containing flavoprotein (pyridoxamine 5'-phosphate oxidase superfamily)
MTDQEPIAELDPRFSDPDATATPWAEARSQLEDAEIFWLSTVRPDGRPHVTPLIAVWLQDSLWFVTGPTERKAMNLAENPRCVLTTGCNNLSEGLDVVVEGEAVRVVDDAMLQQGLRLPTQSEIEPDAMAFPRRLIK